MTKPLYFYNGTTFELVGPTTPQSPIAYQTSAPTAPATGDLWIDSDGDVDTYNRQLTRYYFVATAGQTSISGIDANGLTLAYVAGSEAVYINGALQVRGQDYTATNGTSVTGLTALAVNDVVEIFAYTAFTVANAYTKSETDNLVGTSAGLKLLIPSSIAVGSGSGSVTSTGTVTFSAASSVSLNDVFSATYDTYKIIIDVTKSTSLALILKLRVGGADNSSSLYQTQIQTYSNTTVGANRQTNTTSFQIGNTSDSPEFGVIEFLNPFAAKATAMSSKTNSTYSGTISSRYGDAGHNSTTSFDGFSVITSTGTITGSVSVYGYKD